MYMLHSLPSSSVHVAPQRMIPRPRLAGIAIVFTIFVTVLFHSRSDVYNRYFDHGKAESDTYLKVKYGIIITDRPAASTPTTCPDHPDGLHELANSPDIRFPLRYARREIVVHPKAGVERLSVTKTNDNLVPRFQEIASADACELKEGRRIPPLHLDVPVFSARIDASHILFGAATTLDRLDASIPFFQRWLTKTGARLFVVVTGNEGVAPEPQRMEDLQARMRELGMLVTLVAPLDSEDRDIVRYFSLVRILNQNKAENTKWFGLIDDDTFFTSISTLVSRLGDFDHRKRWYLGAISEDWWTVVRYSLIAMGGGGIFLSPPMIDTLDENYETCKASAKTIFGDHRIAECINQTTDVRLTQFDGLYQIDLHGTY